MNSSVLLALICTIAMTSAWSPYPPVPRGPMRFTRFAPHPPPHIRPHLHPNLHVQHKIPVPVVTSEIEDEPQQRPKRGHDDYDHDHDHDHDDDHHHDIDHHQNRNRDRDRKPTSGIVGPIHTFVKTDKNANYKWGVRHHVGDKYAS